MGDALFEFLAIRKELLKEKMVRDADPALQHRAKELSDLLVLFEPINAKTE